MAKTPKPAIVRQPRRKVWRQHCGPHRNSVFTLIRLPNGDMRGKTFAPARRGELRRQDRAEWRALRDLPGTKIPRPGLAYLENMVSVPLVWAEVEGRLWRSRQSVRRYPARPVRQPRP